MVCVDIDAFSLGVSLIFCLLGVVYKFCRIATYPFLFRVAQVCFYRQYAVLLTVRFLSQYPQLFFSSALILASATDSVDTAVIKAPASVVKISTENIAIPPVDKRAEFSRPLIAYAAAIATTEYTPAADTDTT